MILLKTRRYRRSSAKLPRKIQHLLFRQEKLLAENIFNPKLHTKKLKMQLEERIFSFRITREYRGLFRIEKNEIILFEIGERKDIYRSF